jgi:hypothetical protein
MTSFPIVPLLVVLLAPDPAEPASDAPPDPAAPPAEPALAGEGAPEAVAPHESESGPEAAAPATAAEPLENPFAVPPPTAAVPPPPPVVAPPRPARPIVWRLDFAVTAGTTVVRDPGLRAFAERRNLPETGISTVFDFRLAEGRFFLGGVAYQHASRRGDGHGSLGTRVELHEPQVLGRVSFMIVEGIDAFARGGVGPSIVDTRLHSDGFETANQRNVLPRVDGRAGVSLYLPKAWLPRKQASRISAGLDLGLGYAWRGRIDVQPVLEQDDDPLRATTASWGTLSLHGLSWGVGMFLRVM